MKKIIFALGFLIHLSGFTQVEDWYKVDISRIGYKNTTFTFENVPIGNNLPAGKFSELKVTGGSFELSTDVYNKYMYFSIDLSTFLDVGLTLFQFDDDKQRWWRNDDYFVTRSDILPIRLAFGHNIGKYVALYVGGQYSLSSVGLGSRGGYSYRDTYIGGHTYGVGGHLFTAYKLFNARYSYMYNWQSSAGLFSGNGINNELVLSFGFADIGLFIKFAHLYNTSNAGYLPEDRTKLFKSAYEGEPRQWQSAHYATQFQFSIGIYAPGLLSGITKSGSKILTKTGQGVAKERREEKRRKIEYKD